MAEYNDWGPELGPVNGLMQQEPRVFGHDAKAVVPGALNARLPDLRVLKVTTVGSGYDASDVGDTLTQTSTTGSGTGMEVNITEIDGTTLGAVTVITSGSGYAPGNTITFSAASSGGVGGIATVQADGITLPNVTNRGAIIYNGKNAAQDIAIITEAGSQIEFKQVQSGDVVGSKTPMLAMAVRNDNSPTDLIAIY
jgi:hypothetical protein